MLVFLSFVVFVWFWGGVVVGGGGGGGGGGGRKTPPRKFLEFMTQKDAVLRPFPPIFM